MLAQLVGRQVSGELLVVSNDARWSLWLQRGKLLFATSSQNGFDALRLEGRQLFPDSVSDLVLAQLQLYHRQYTQQDNELMADYRAVRWLFEQGHISFDQAGELIHALAITTLTSLLKVSKGSYEVNSFGNIADYPAFCSLDLRTLVEQCHRDTTTVSSKRSVAPSDDITSAQSRQTLKQRITPKTDLKTLLQQTSGGTFDPSDLGSDMLHSATTVKGGTSPCYQLVCIDSDNQSIQALKGYLEDTVFSITSVDDVATAVADLAKCQPDLIMLSTTMDGLDGFDLCSHLRRHPQYKDVPIILLAKQPNLIGRIRAKLCGASFYIGKPINRTKLMVNLFTLLV
ncbi:MAG: response regulator [Cyanobacteria bacterium P01_H01_bin.26]